MIWHPFTWTFWLAATTGTLLYAAGAIGAFDVALNWTPSSFAFDQLRRERRAEMASLLGQWSLGCLSIAALAGVVGVAIVWHLEIPGAMCGTGVLQAMGSNGSRAMLFWGAVLIILYVWRVLDRLDANQPQGVLSQVNARVMICAAPFLTMALFYSFRALMRVDTAPPVSCCAVLYDKVVNDDAVSAALTQFRPLLAWGSLLGATVLLVLSIWQLRFPEGRAVVMPAVIGILWGVGAPVAVTQVWSAYYYQVLSHPCPWCLFGTDYGGVGFVIFGLIAVVFVESIVLWFVDRVRRQRPLLAMAAEGRIQAATRRIILALIGFTVLTVGPALWWRLHNGVWLNGAF